MGNQRKPQINIEMNNELLTELKTISTIIEIPYAQIVREAIYEKIADLKQNHPRLAIKQETVPAG